MFSRCIGLRTVGLCVVVVLPLARERERKGEGIGYSVGFSRRRNEIKLINVDIGDQFGGSGFMRNDVILIIFGKSVVRVISYCSGMWLYKGG